MCATDSWGAHESFMHPIFVLKNGCDNRRRPPPLAGAASPVLSPARRREVEGVRLPLCLSV
jgi:hypothetical protein